MDQLADDLTINILARLLIRDILSCKRVCTSWYNLISNPHFTTYHAKHSPFTTIFRGAHDNCRRKSLCLLEFTCNGSFINMQINPRLPQVEDISSNYGVTIIGSCVGSIFLLHRRYHRDRVIDKVYFCNPLLTEYVKVSEDKVVNSARDVLEYRVGYVPSIEKYKLVRLFYDSNKVKEAKILTVGLDKDWRVVNDPFSYWKFRSKKMITYNGVHHWLDKKNDQDDKIYTFDLLHEKSGVISKPRYLSQSSFFKMSLAIVKDRVSLVDWSFTNMNVWAMREYGVAESWYTEVITLGCCISRRDGSWFNNDLHPVAELPNGNLVFSDDKLGTRLYFFDFGTRYMSEIKVRGDWAAVGTIYVNKYAPRFYSLKGTESG